MPRRLHVALHKRMPRETTTKWAALKVVHRPAIERKSKRHVRGRFPGGRIWVSVAVSDQSKRRRVRTYPTNQRILDRLKLCTAHCVRRFDRVINSQNSVSEDRLSKPVSYTHLTLPT